MNENSLVSVIVPTFNRADTIVRCLESIANQTYFNIEIIVIDDCSTDNTEEIINQFSDSRVTYHRLDRNRRACYARNYGCRIAKGKYIAFQDSDDVWHYDKLEKELDYLIKEEKDFVFCGMNRISEEKTFFFPTQNKINTEKDFFRQELFWNAVSTQTILMKKEVFDTVQFDVDFRKYQDWDFAIRIAQNYKVGYLPEPLVDSFIQTNSVSVTVNHYEALKKIYEKYTQYIINDDELEAWYQMLFGDCFRKSDPQKAKIYYKDSLKRRFNFKTAIKYLTTLFGFKI